MLVLVLIASILLVVASTIMGNSLAQVWGKGTRLKESLTHSCVNADGDLWLCANVSDGKSPHLTTLLKINQVCAHITMAAVVVSTFLFMWRSAYSHPIGKRAVHISCFVVISLTILSSLTSIVTYALYLNHSGVKLHPSIGYTLNCVVFSLSAIALVLFSIGARDAMDIERRENLPVHI